MGRNFQAWEQPGTLMFLPVMARPVQKSNKSGPTQTAKLVSTKRFHIIILNHYYTTIKILLKHYCKHFHIKVKVYNFSYSYPHKPGIME